MFNYMFKGRIGRLGYLLGYLFITLPLVAFILFYALLNVFMGDAYGPLRVLVNVALFLFGAAWIVLASLVSIGIAIRRWHDMGQTGWLVLLQFLPFVSFVSLVIQLFVPGTKGPNQYGFPVSSNNFKDVLFGSASSQIPASLAQPDTQNQQPPQDPPAPGTYGAGTM